MSWYKDEKDLWTDLIDTVSTAKSISPLMVEKDTIQSLFLQKLTETNTSLVFKGGTSLSKAYSLINRFSEDIDVAINVKPSEAARKQIKNDVISISESIGLRLTNPEAIMSRRDFNRYVFEYDSLFQSAPANIIVETSFHILSYPVNIHEVNSIIGKYCSEKNLVIPTVFSAACIEMPVQSLERTLIDKTFAVCDYYLKNNPERNSRHLYDIAKLLPYVDISDGFNELVSKVRQDRAKSISNPSASPEYNISKLIEEIISKDFYRRDYEEITERLLYENVSYADAVKDGIVKVSELDVFL